MILPINVIGQTTELGENSQHFIKAMGWSEAQWSRALAARTEDPGWFSTPV